MASAGVTQSDQVFEPLPAGGSAGQILTRTSAGAVWDWTPNPDFPGRAVGVRQENRISAQAASSSFAFGVATQYFPVQFPQSGTLGSVMVYASVASASAVLTLSISSNNNGVPGTLISTNTAAMSTVGMKTFSPSALTVVAGIYFFGVYATVAGSSLASIPSVNTWSPFSYSPAGPGPTATGTNMNSYSGSGAPVSNPSGSWQSASSVPWFGWIYS